MSSCCPQVMEPTRATVGGHVGVTKKYGNTNLFVAGPERAKAGVIAFPDIFGPDSGRTKHDAENLSKLGYAVVVVDVADGDYLNMERLGEVLDWLKAHPYDGYISSRVNDAIAYLHQEVGVETISSYGYCLGAWVGACLVAQDKPVVTGHVSFHPSWRNETMLYGEGAVEKLAERVKVPNLLLAASNDIDEVKAGGAVEAILKAKGGEIGELSKAITFPDVVHGWVIRGDLSDPVVKASVDKAWAEALSFMEKVNPAPLQ